MRIEKRAADLRTKQRKEEEAENFIPKKRSTGGGATVRFEKRMEGLRTKRRKAEEAEKFI